MGTAEKFTDEQLKFFLSEGDVSTFKVLFNRYYAQLVYFATKFTGDLQDAEDVVMEVFSKFWLKREGAVEIVSLSSFLYSSVRNACIDLLRKEKRSTLLFHEASDQIFDQNDIVEGEEIFARLLQQVLDNIESLPTQCKTIFKLIYLEGKTTTVVAEMLGLSIQSVRNQKARGLNLLRQKIKPTHLLSLMLVQITLLHI